MDISSAMNMAMPTTTGSGAPTATSAMSSMGTMNMGGGGSCKISMLWNWYSVDSCFISSSWRNTSKGMFAGSCIGVVFLVVFLEFLRRAGKEYDRFLLRSHQQSRVVAANSQLQSDSASESRGFERGPVAKGQSMLSSTRTVFQHNSSSKGFRPTVLQQAIRALLHLLQFAVAYFVMLLAMYYNGYIIICIFIGAYIGAFIFSWDSLGLEGPQEDATVCCG